MKKITVILVALVLAVVVILLAHQQKVRSEEFQYVGDKKCIACHRPEFQAWQKDYHAKSLDDLKPGTKCEAKTKAKLDPKKDYSTDASCLVCHATGYGKPAAPGAELNNVGCEACHGPGSKYKSPTIMSKAKYAANRDAQHKAAMQAGLVEPNEKLCVTCHNAKSPTWKGFDYKKMIEEVKHKK